MLKYHPSHTQSFFAKRSLTATVASLALTTLGAMKQLVLVMALGAQGKWSPWQFQVVSSTVLQQCKLGITI